MQKFLISRIMALGLFFGSGIGLAYAANPIVPNRGLNDPHIHIFGDRAYVFASHDRSATNQTFVMDDWWVWSSPDLVHWTNECVIKPEQTFIGKAFTGCWAVDAAERNGKYYFYFSQKNDQTGVIVGDSPAGPWRDPLGKPLLPAGIVPTHAYDNCVFQDDDAKPYIIFGVWDYYIARLNNDMISLAEKPRLLELDRKFGPYGEGKTDDKPNLHKANGHYRRAAHPTSLTYRFEKDRQGWYYTDATDAGWPIRGELNVHLDGPTPRIMSPDFLMSAEAAPRLAIEAAFPEGCAKATLMWRRLGEKDFVNTQSKSFSVVPDGQFHNYEITLSTSPEYVGVITQLRLDVLPASKRGCVRLKSVTLGKDALLRETRNEPSVGIAK